MLLLRQIIIVFACFQVFLPFLAYAEVVSNSIQQIGTLERTEINGVPVTYYVPSQLPSRLSADGGRIEVGAAPIVMIADPNPSPTLIRIPPPSLGLTAVNRQTTPTSSFVIDYVAAGGADPWNASCLTFPEAAKTSFEAAVNIWAETLVSSVPIRIRACWSTMSGGTLGYAGGGGLYKNFTNVPRANTFYAESLANALSGSDHNASAYDMHITYNSNFSWYYGTDGNTPSNQYDLMSVVLHEIAHGLNFAGSMGYSAGTGSYGYSTIYPDIYDVFVKDGGGNSLIDTGIYVNPSLALGTALVSNDLWFHGSTAMAANGGQRVKLYAPVTWQAGSSYSHVDYTTFAGGRNQLMRYAISAGVSIHNPGPVVRGMLNDMGWTVNLDVTPASFSFTDQTDVALSTPIESNLLTVSDIDTTTGISITGGEYSINGGIYTSTAGTVTNGQTVKVRHTSSSSNSSIINTVLTIGGVSDTFSSTTVAVGGDITPDAFTFTDQTGVALSTVVESNAITVSGINAAANISVTGGEYSIGSGAYTSTAGTVTNGQTVKVRHTSSSSNSTAVDTVLTIGGVSDTFSTTTLANANVDSDGDGVIDPNDGSPNDAKVATPNDVQGNRITVAALTNLQNVVILPDTDSSLPTTGKPDSSAFIFPNGVIKYIVTGTGFGATVTVTLIYPSTIPAGSKVYKITAAGYTEFAGASISGNQVTLTLTDGGSGDADGLANNSIEDPVAVAVPVTSNSGSTGGGGGGGGSFPLGWSSLLLILGLLLKRHRQSSV